MATRKIDEVVIIYNPKSTGNSADNAKRLRAELKEHSFKTPVKLFPTKHRGHAEEIAKRYADKKQVTLLISSSGDGGYHELINGILRSGAKNIIAGLLPSGNANDHFSALGDKDFPIDAIIHQHPRKVDVLKLEATMNGRPWTRYAHSYIGLGISPVIGRELTKTKLNFFNEKIILMRQLLAFDDIRIEIKGKRVRIMSLIFANIPTMSKVLKIAKKGKVNDGKFEVNIIKAEGQLGMFARLFQASTLGLKETSSVKQFTFKTIRPTLIQLDGEVFTLDSESTATVSVVSEALKVII
jgi:diacylglycerol kinase family enzyme